MKVLVALVLCGLPATLSAQATLQTFTSPDRTFQFKYSSLLIRCTEQRQEEGQPGSWIPEDSCQSYMPVCDDVGSQGSTTLVCFAYPKVKFKDYPTFGAAAFSVAKVKRAVTEKKCLSGSPDWVVDPHRSGKTAIINHVEFKVFGTDGVGMGHGLDGYVYRNFHRNTCYELSINMTSMSTGAFETPPKEFTQKDYNEVNGRLKQALESFRFLK